MGNGYLIDTNVISELHSWLEEELPAWFGGRLLPIDDAVADRWGRLLAEAGRPLPAIDSLLAATALAHDLVLTTRNVRDLAGLPVALVNPWDGEAEPEPSPP
jgi:predicted nucleic acid-binding protein